MTFFIGDVLAETYHASHFLYGSNHGASSPLWQICRPFFCVATKHLCTHKLFIYLYFL